MNLLFVPATSQDKLTQPTTQVVRTNKRPKLVVTLNTKRRDVQGERAQIDRARRAWSPTLKSLNDAFRRR